LRPQITFTIHVDRNQEEDFILDGNPHCPNKMMPADNTTTNNQTSEAQPPSPAQCRIHVEMNRDGQLILDGGLLPYKEGNLNVAHAK
jgi:hypothetical protein